MQHNIIAVGQYDKKISAVTCIFGFFNDIKSAESFMIKDQSFLSDINGRYCFGVFYGKTNDFPLDAYSPTLLIPVDTKDSLESKDRSSFKLVTPGPWISNAKLKHCWIWIVVSENDYDISKDRFKCLDEMLKLCQEMEIGFSYETSQPIVTSGWKLMLEGEALTDRFQKFNYNNYKTVDLYQV